jgi:hypothetical protein
MPKTHLDRMGWILDSAFRINGIRRYLHEKVQVARNLIYQVGRAVTGACVDNLLKPTSAVPTIVSDDPVGS